MVRSEVRSVVRQPQSSPLTEMKTRFTYLQSTMLTQKMICGIILKDNVWIGKTQKNITLLNTDVALFNA